MVHNDAIIEPKRRLSTKREYRHRRIGDFAHYDAYILSNTQENFIYDGFTIPQHGVEYTTSHTNNKIPKFLNTLQAFTAIVKIHKIC